ncbi:MAG: hypothetical protein AB8B71_07820, partial [Paracoccaceae bacterium]
MTKEVIQNEETKEPFVPLPGSGLLATHEYPYWSSGIFSPFSAIAQQCICHDYELAQSGGSGKAPFGRFADERCDGELLA